MNKTASVQFRRVPKTQLAFVNVPIVPVRARSGEPRYLSAAWGGALHVFDAQGLARTIRLPEGFEYTYAFTPDVVPGLAWAVLTGLTKVVFVQVDVDDGRILFEQDVPLRGIVWSAVTTQEGRLVCSAHPGDVLIYDTRRREVVKLLSPLHTPHRAGKYLQRAADDHVIIPLMLPGAELIRLDANTGEFSVAAAEAYRGPNNFLPASCSLLPSGRYAIPQADAVTLLDYPTFKRSATVAYPGSGEWQTFRNEEDGRLFAHRGDGGALYALDEGDRWAEYLPRFPLQVGRAQLGAMFAALPANRMLGLGTFGEVIEYGSHGQTREVAQLDNYGTARLCALAPGEGNRVFTTTFINSSFQELDLKTGQGRNVRPCQKLSGQVSAAVWHRGRLWLACYAGAEVTVYDPAVPGDWPENPRPFADIGHEQLRPVSLHADGDHLWCDTHAQYAKYGGALVRISIRSGECRVWRHLVADHNPTGIVLDTVGRRIYGGTTVWPDMQSAPAAKGPAAVYAFDMDRETTAWVAQPIEGAQWMTVHALWRDTVIACAGDRLIQLRTSDGRVEHIFDRPLPPGDPVPRVFVGGDNALYLASSEGLFEYDLDRGPGERLIDGPVAHPCVSGGDLLFVRGYRVGLIERLWPA